MIKEVLINNSNFGGRINPDQTPFPNGNKR
jgi:hypothetical protein